MGIPDPYPTHGHPQLILQNCFASMAWFTRLNFLSPIPPLFYSDRLYSNALDAFFLTPWSCPHQKFLTIESKFLQIASGTLKQEKVQRGIVWRTEDIRVVLSNMLHDKNRALKLKPQDLHQFGMAGYTKGLLCKHKFFHKNSSAPSKLS